MENLTKGRRLISWVQNAKHFTSGSVQNLRVPSQCMNSKKLNRENSLFESKTVKTNYNFIRKYSVDEDPPKNENVKLPEHVINFVNGDTLITVMIIIFFIIDYKKYKEKGEGYLLKKDY